MYSKAMQDLQNHSHANKFLLSDVSEEQLWNSKRTTI